MSESWSFTFDCLLMAAAVLIGLKLATRKSQAFPYGLYKVENLVAAGLAGMIFLTAYEIARDALLAPPSAVRADVWMLALLLITTAVPFIFSRIELRVGEAANSPALIADTREYRVHVFTTGLAFAALLSDRLDFPLDRAAAMIIVLAVLKTGWGLLSNAMRVLLDASLDGETLRRIRAVIDGDPAVTEVRWITGRNAGRFRFVEAGLVLRVFELDKAAAAIGRIETDVRAAVRHVERVLIHVEAPGSPRLRYAVPLADHAGTISAHFGEAPYFALVTVCRSDGRVEETRTVANPYRMMEKAKGIRVAEWLVAQKVDGVLLKEDVHGKGPEYVLRDAGILLHHTDALTLAEAQWPNAGEEQT
jgi:cation diffusion facilitator family transporter